MLLVDGTFLIYKSYYSANNLRERDVIENQSHLNKVVRNKFLSTISTLLSNYDLSSLFIVFDCLGDNYRHKIMESYKANRPEKPHDILEVKNEIYSFLEEHNFSYQIAENVEGDDLIASYISQNKEDRINVYTGDKDLAALVSDRVTLLLERNYDVKEINTDNFHHYFSVPASRLFDFKALQGDRNDNIKGVKGLHKNQVIHLLMEYTSIEEYFREGTNHYLYEKLLKEKKRILTNKRILKMRKDCPIEINKNHAGTNHIYIPKGISNRIGWD